MRHWKRCYILAIRYLTVLVTRKRRGLLANYSAVYVKGVHQCPRCPQQLCAQVLMLADETEFQEASYASSYCSSPARRHLLQTFRISKSHCLNCMYVVSPQMSSMKAHPEQRAYVEIVRILVTIFSDLVHARTALHIWCKLCPDSSSPTMK